MTAFDHTDLDRVDWAMFQNGWVTLYWKRDILEEECAWLSEHGYRIHHLDCAKWASTAEALRDIGSTLSFPDYYGQNLDALNDCLSDIEVPRDGGTAIVLQQFDRFTSVNRNAAQAILDILASNARSFMLFGQRLAILVQSDDAGLSFVPVGSTPVGWNRRERLLKQRGL